MSRHGAFVRNMRIIANHMKLRGQRDKKYSMVYIPITNEIDYDNNLNLSEMDDSLYEKMKDEFSDDFAFGNNLCNDNSEYFDIGLFAEYHKFWNRCELDMEYYLSEVDNSTAVSFTTSLQETNRKQVEKDFSKLCTRHNFHAIVNRKFVDDNTLHISSICWKLDCSRSSIYANSSPITRMFRRSHPPNSKRLVDNISLA